MPSWTPKAAATSSPRQTHPKERRGPGALFCGTARAAFAAHEEGLDRGLHLGEFAFGREVFREVGNELRSHAVLRELQYFVGILVRAFADLDYVADLHFARRFHRRSADLHFVAFAGFRRFRTRLEAPDRPDVFVYSYAVCHNDNVICWAEGEVSVFS